MTSNISVFDGHNDVLLRLYKSKSSDAVSDFLAGEDSGHIDLKKARAGSFVGGLFAMYSPSPGNFASLAEQMRGGKYAVPLPDPLDMDAARKSVVGELAILMRIIRQSQGAVALCRTTAEIKSAIQRGSLAVVLHLEGAEAIDGDLHFLDVLYAAGLRSLGPVWSRHNIFGHGVPFAFPGGPDTGGGLTAAGEKLVSACNEMKILVDLSHITEKGFWDVAELSSAPLVATHSNVHAICANPRNLTADQLKAIRDSDGMVGLNFATGFLRPDGAWRTDTGLDVMLRHLDAMIEAVGETRVGLGSDFDGAMLPAAIGSSAGLQVLIEAMHQHGYGDALVQRLAHGNWLDLLARVIDR